MVRHQRIRKTTGMPDSEDKGGRLEVGQQRTERRASRRSRVLKSGLAAYNEQFSTFPCIVRNVSESGARLDLDELAQVPPSFVLHIGVDGYQVECERVWRDGKACGVKFVGEKSHSPYFHPQKVGTSEQHFSPYAERAMRMHEEMEDAREESRPAILEARKPRRAPHPTFGRRT